MMIRTLLSAVALLGTATPAPPPIQAPITPATTEGVEILRRILAETLDQAFPPADNGNVRVADRRYQLSIDEGYQGLVTRMWAGEQTVTHSRAFQVPGSGLFFQLDLALPVVSKKSEPKAAQAPAETKDDEWERMRREVRGDTRGGPTRDLFKGQLAADAPEVEIDPAAIERVTESVLKTVARHASRIEGLASQDVITVALHLSGKASSAWSTLEVPEPAPDTAPDEADEAQGFTSINGYFTGAHQILFAAQNEAPEQRLIVQVTVADVSGYAEGGYTRLRDRARVVHY